MQRQGIESSLLTYLCAPFGEAIWAFEVFHSMTMKFLVCISKAPDTPFAFSTALIEEALPQVKDIVEACKDVAYVA